MERCIEVESKFKIDSGYSDFQDHLNAPYFDPTPPVHCLAEWPDRHVGIGKDYVV